MIVKIGDRVRLINMPADPDPIPIGTEGTVRAIYEFSWRERTIAVDWDNGRVLNLIEGIDEFAVL